MTEATNNAEATTATAVTFHNAVMPISVTKDGKRHFSHFLAYGLPTLDMVNPNMPTPDSWEEEEAKEGEDNAVIVTPVYSDERLNYLQAALTQRIQGLARSRDKANQPAITTWEEMAEAGAGSKYPVQLKQFRADFLAFLQSEKGGASEAQQAALMTYTDSKVLMSTPSAKKAKIAVWFERFLKSYGEKVNEVGSVINGINHAIETNLDDVEL